MLPIHLNAHLQMRILGDPELRLQYDDIRQERLLGGISRKQQLLQQVILQPKILMRNRPTTGHGSPIESMDQPAVFTKKPRYITPDEKLATMVPTYTSETDEEEDDEDDDDDTRQECPTVDNTYAEEQTIMSETSYRSEGTLAVLQHETESRTMIKKVKDELFGAMEDTATTFAQVLNVFTLQEEDIMAVTKRIDKAARQMKTSL
jgi:hypothetical protein